MSRQKINNVVILVLYYSRHGMTESLAKAIALGVESTGATAMLRRVPDVSTTIEATEARVPDSGVTYASIDDLKGCDGLAIGSPTHFGNMAAPMKYFLDTTSQLWLKGSLINKPASVFSCSSSLHGGQESTLLSMMLPLFHHGMLVLGLPYSEAGLHTTDFGGTPYGVTAVSNDTKTNLTNTEQELATAQGKRLALAALNQKDSE